MLTTDELKEHVTKIVEERIQPHFEEVFKIRTYFTSDTTKGREGTYVFSQNGTYHCAGVERGRVQSESETTSLEQAVYWALEDTIFPVAVDYECKHRVSGVDFRRQLFQYLLEAFGYAGEAYRAMRQARIDWALEQAPYSDE